MREELHGHIIKFSFIGGLVGCTATGFYHASKFAAEGLSESLLKKVASLGIKVLIVKPAPFRTDWAGRSISRAIVKIADYNESVGTRLKKS